MNTLIIQSVTRLCNQTNQSTPLIHISSKRHGFSDMQRIDDLVFLCTCMCTAMLLFTMHAVRYALVIFGCAYLIMII